MAREASSYRAERRNAGKDADASSDAKYHAKLVSWAEDAEVTSADARQLSERDRDYYDHKQWTEAEIRQLKDRGQPVVTINRIAPKMDFVFGLEKQTRTDPRAAPRNLETDEEAANAATDGLRFVCDQNRYEVTRSAAWKNLTIEGSCGIEVRVDKTKRGKIKITVEQHAWDRLLIDPRSVKPDGSDARYLGTVLWMDLDRAQVRWSTDAQKEILAQALSESSNTDTYDDKPREKVWADKDRQRVKIVMLYHRDANDVWQWCEFTRAGKLDGGAVTYLNDEGDTDCPLLIASLKVDRKNQRYGMVRGMISPQDEVNKRRSKMLHLLNHNQMYSERGAVDDVESAKRELAKPDGWLEVKPGRKIDRIPNDAAVQGQAELLQESKAEIENMGPNVAMSGKVDDNDSGRALQLKQQGGFVEIADALDCLRQLDFSVYRAIWNRIKQFWTDEMWLRVRDQQDDLGADTAKPKFVGLNVPQTVADLHAAQVGEDHPEVQQLRATIEGQTHARVKNNVAEMDVDIVLEDVPDTTTLQSEQFKELTDLARAGVALPPKVLIAGSQLRNKKQLIEMMDAAQQQDPEIAKKAAIENEERLSVIELNHAKTDETEAKALKTRTEARVATRKPPAPPTELPRPAAASQPRALTVA
jgi:hypothetical protein